MDSQGIDAWLLADFRGSNQLLPEILHCNPSRTRRVFLLVPQTGEMRLLVHQVDASGFSGLGIGVQTYTSHADLQEALHILLVGMGTVAMEYSPGGLLPMVSFVDAGTVEMVRAIGVEVVSSAGILQYSLARWTEADLRSHQRAARKLGRIMQEAFSYAGSARATEYDVAQFILRRFGQEGLATDSGPVVAANRNSAFPHYSPAPTDRRPIGPGDWVLIDMWAREASGPFADITWVGFWGFRPSPLHQEVFDLVARARELALELLSQAWAQGLELEGRDVDAAVRDFLSASPYGSYFTHRLGHSLGKRPHGFGANLDSFETVDSRALIPGLAFSVEPGLYLPDFGVRLEVNVHIGPTGPAVTTPMQTEIVRVGAG